MPLATQPSPARLPLPGGEPDATVRVHPIVTGYMHAPPALFERPKGTLSPVKTLAQFAPPRPGWRWLPIPAFLVEHPRVGPIMIDTGLHPRCASDVAANMGQAGRLIYRVRMDSDQAVSFQLPKRGVRPDDVAVVIITHLHIDHASAVSEFPRATFVLDEHEWRQATEGGVLSGYHAPQFDHAFDWRTLDYKSDGEASFASFASSLDLFGDGSVRVISTPGHTRGHQSVLLRTEKRELLVLGDAAYTLDGLRQGTMPWVVADEHLRRRSISEINGYLDRAPDVIAIPSHDFDLWPGLEPVYE